MGRLKDISGQRFNRLFVLGRAENRGKKVYWTCQCDCGKTVETVHYSLRRGTSGSCGCLQREVAARNGHARADKETPKRSLYAKYKQNAQRKNLVFELTFELFCWLTTLPCCYCGGDSSSREPHAVYPLIYTGIDRWNNDLGYTEDNSVPCCKVCNFLKVKLSGEDFIAQCKKIATYRGSCE
jgi:hypothetical protein